MNKVRTTFLIILRIINKEDSQWSAMLRTWALGLDGQRMRLQLTHLLGCPIESVFLGIN